MTTRPRRLGLGVTLLVTALVVTLGFARGLSVCQLSRATLVDQRMRAQNLADSVIHLALSKILADATYGKTPMAAF